MPGTKRHDHRETIEPSEINASVFLGQDTRTPHQRGRWDPEVLDPLQFLERL
jgi:hypothetical protein